MRWKRSVRRLGGEVLSLVLLGGGALSCASPARPAPPAWDVLALSIDAPSGGAGSGAQRCSGAQPCADIEPGAHIEGQAEIRSALGARAAFDLGGGVTLTMIGDAAIACRSREDPGVNVARGLFTLDAVAIEDAASARPARLSLGDRDLDIDPSTPASVAIHARDGAPSSILVRRGRVTLRSSAGAIDLRSGEGATWTAGIAATKRIGAAIAADLDVLPPADDEAERGAIDRPRGLGTMTARAPGTTDVISGVRLASHNVHVVIHDGFARTTIEEVFANDTARVLEGRYVFPVPPDASVSRLGLWVGDNLVEGEMVERDRAARIFKGIVEDTVRPRDPALLEWVSGGEVSLKVFPLPAHGTRKVVLAYDQAIEESGGHGRYLYPLSLGADRAVTIDDFTISIDASTTGSRLVAPSTQGYAATLASDGDAIRASYHQKGFTPGADFAFTYDRAADAAAPRVNAYHAAKSEGFVAMRLPVRWPDGAPPPDRARRDRAIVIDVSQSQSKETLAGEVALAEGLIERLDPAERFVLLACDSACSTWPEDGLASTTAADLASARRWLGQRSIAGSSDIAGAIQAAARRLAANGKGQIAYFGDGAATSGELSAESIARAVSPDLAAQKIDLRLFGAGRTVDEVTLGGLARALGATYERVSTGEPLARRLDEIALALESPILTNARLEIPEGVHEVFPKVLPNLRVGQDLSVIARVRPGEEGVITLRGSVAGAEVSTEVPIRWDSAASPENPIVPRLWAAAKIADLEASNQPDAIKEVVALSRANYVLSRRTALLVLENDSMFSELGIERTHGQSAAQKVAPPIGAASAAPQIGDAASFGMIGTIGHGAGNSVNSGDPFAPIAPWGGLSAEGTAGGGLGLSGIGEGGGGTGGGGTGEGFGSGHGRLSGSHRSSAPQVRLAAPSVSGSIPPEVIRRIVRQNMGRFRLCYENGLRENAELHGKVGVRFIIGREGTVTASGNAGSDLPNAGVVACVIRSFQSLAFPTPEGGIVTVTTSIAFAPAEPESSARWTSPPMSWDAPTITHRTGDDRWMTEGEDALNKLRQALGAGASIRQRHEALIRGLIARGRFAEAKSAARRFVDIDPDLPRARELLAEAAAAQGDADLALTELDAEVESSPASSDLHARVARAFEAAGDERRACAHLRSARDLRPGSDEAEAEALRCAARLGDRDRVLAEIAAMKSPGKLTAQLAAQLAQGPAPARDESKFKPGEVDARVACADSAVACPIAVVITPRGDVISPWTPGSARGAEGTYRTVIVGGSRGARGELTVRAQGAVKKFPVSIDGAKTIAVTTVTPSPFSGFGFGRGIGTF